MLKKLISDESGRALVLTLIILGIGVLLIPVFLSHASTNLYASQAAEEGLKEQYAADAGVEYALYRLANNDDVPFNNEETPTLVNNMAVTVTVESEGAYYKITSIAQDTVIRSYVNYTPGGNLEIYEGALVSAGDITLAKDCTVAGNIRYGGSFTHPTDSFTHTYGSEVQQEIVFPLSDEFAETYKEEALAGGIYTGTLTIDSSCSLGPLYITGDLNVGMYHVVTLEGTIYVEGSIWVQKDAEFTGSGSIVAVGDIHMQKVTGFGTDSDSVIMSITGDISFDKEAILEAFIYAPNGLIQFDKDSSVTGAVVGAEINAHKLELFAYDASFYDGFELPGYQKPGFRVRTYNINP